jgi:hypothetical protein
MSEAGILDQLAQRKFSFTPPIRNVEGNEWSLVRSTWSEILVAQSDGNLELWIPRRYVGEISGEGDGPAVITLTRELEYGGGAVWPVFKQTFETNVPNRAERAAEPAAYVSSPGQISRQPKTESRLVRLIAIGLGVVTVAGLLTAFLLREGPPRQRVTYTARDQSYLDLKRGDDYYDIQRVLGKPQRDSTRGAEGGLQFRALSYPDRGFVVILMGDRLEEATYIGTVDLNWRPIHWVSAGSGGDTRSLLGGLKRF